MSEQFFGDASEAPNNSESIEDFVDEDFNEKYQNENVPTNTFKCRDCGTKCERYRGMYEVCCPKCGAPHNASGQRLRDDWRGNPSNYDDDISDLEGYEIQHAGD